jgi:hypothetical protein
LKKLARALDAGIDMVGSFNFAHHSRYVQYLVQLL